jgi:Outer membrane protein beta-barrel domain
MSFNAKMIPATVFAAAFAVGTAHAAEVGFYLGGSIGQTTVEFEETVDDGDGGSTDFHFDSDDTGYKLFVGYNFLPWLGVEGGYIDFGNPADDLNIPNFPNVDADIEVTGWEAFLVGTLPLGPVDLFIKGGGVAAELDAELKVTGFPSESFNESDEYGAYGVGAAFNFGKFAIRAEYEAYDVDIDDLYFISVGATYHL